jgi:hypothetical protein
MASNSRKTMFTFFLDYCLFPHLHLHHPYFHLPHPHHPFHSRHHPIKHRFYTWLVKVILHQFWVKKIFPWKFNLEYSGTFTKLFMHVSSRNMFPTTRNLQIRVHVYHPHHCCGDWLTFGCFVPMIADHDLMTKR